MKKFLCWKILFLFFVVVFFSYNIYSTTNEKLLDLVKRKRVSRVEDTLRNYDFSNVIINKAFLKNVTCSVNDKEARDNVQEIGIIFLKNKKSKKQLKSNVLTKVFNICFQQGLHLLSFKILRDKSLRKQLYYTKKSINQLEENLTGSRKFYIKILRELVKYPDLMKKLNKSCKNKIFLNLAQAERVWDSRLQALGDCLEDKGFRRELTNESLFTVAKYFDDLANKGIEIERNKIFCEICKYRDLFFRFLEIAEDNECVYVKEVLEDYQEEDYQKTDKDFLPSAVVRSSRRIKERDDKERGDISLIDFIGQIVKDYKRSNRVFVPPRFYRELYPEKC